MSIEWLNLQATQLVTTLYMKIAVTTKQKKTHRYQMMSGDVSKLVFNMFTP